MVNGTVTDGLGVGRVCQGGACGLTQACGCWLRRPSGRAARCWPFIMRGAAGPWAPACAGARDGLAGAVRSALTPYGGGPAVRRDDWTGELRGFEPPHAPAQAGAQGGTGGRCRIRERATIAGARAEGKPRAASRCGRPASPRYKNGAPEARRGGQARAISPSSRPSNMRRPSTLPWAGSTTRSGWGIMPSTLPASLRMPAMLRAEPLTCSA